MFHNPRKAALFISVLGLLSVTTTGLYSVHAEEPAMIAYHEHRESHTTSRETTTWSEKTSTSKKSTSHSTSVNVPDAGIIAGTVLFSGLEKSSLTHFAEGYEDSQPASHGALASIQDKKGKWGLVGMDGTLSVAPAYKSISYQGHGLFSVTGQKGVKYITSHGTVPDSLPPVWDDSAELIAYRENGRWGFKNPQGHVVITPRYKDAYTNFYEGIAFVKDEDGHKIAINNKGNFLFEAPYDAIYPFHNGLAEIRRNVHSFSWSSLAGAAVVGSLTNAHYDEDADYGLSRKDIKRGYINTQGQEIFDSRSDSVYPMTPYGTFIRDKGQIRFADRSGKTIFGPGPYDVDDTTFAMKEGLAALENDQTDKLGAISLVTGETVIPFAYDEVRFLGSDRVELDTGNTHVLASVSTGRAIISPPEDSDILPFGNQSVTWVIGDDKKDFTLLSVDGQILAHFTGNQIKEVSPFHHGFSRVKTDMGTGLMDETGAWALPPQYRTIHFYS